MKKTVDYMCDYCMWPHTYPESDERELYFCPDCGHEMWYMGTNATDEETGIGTNYHDKMRADNSPECKNSAHADTHIIQCPKCQNRNVRKVRIIEKLASILTLGILFTRKPFKCKNCGYTWGRKYHNV